uniref:Uncharacterized protein n=1 Tax=viral metagenome TaxID=1070528 RepID=A0A6C0JKE7_9ZZZZ
MTDYLIDITLKDITDLGNTNYNLFIKIDKNGNVDIKQQYIHLRSGCEGNEYSRISDLLIINDNIPIPSCMINMLKNLFSLPNSPILPNAISRLPLNMRHYENVIESIKILKNDIVNSQSKLIELI